MRRLLLSAIALAAMTAAASAATISFTASEDGGAATTINTGQSASSVGPVSPAATPDFTFQVSGSTQGFLPPPQLLQAQNITVSNTDAGINHILHLQVDATGITGISGAIDFLSHFDVTGQTPGWSTSGFTDLNGVVLNSAGPFSGVSTGVDLSALRNVTSPFNLSAHWDIATNGLAGGTNLGIVISTQAVPGPLVGAGLPGLLGALGLGGFEWRRRKRKLAA